MRSGSRQVEDGLEQSIDAVHDCSVEPARGALIQEALLGITRGC